MKKETRNSKEFDREREFTVVLERVHSDVKAIAESQGPLRDKIDATMGMVAKNTEDITTLNIRVVGIKDELTKINGKLAKIEEDTRIIRAEFGKHLTALETSLK